MSIPSNMDPIGARAAAAGDPILANADGYIVWNGDFTEVTHAKLDTLSNASYLFYNKRNLRSIHPSVLYMPHCSNVDDMFFGCFSLISCPNNNEKISLPSITSCRGMFFDCSSLTKVSLDLPNCITCTNLFMNCRALQSLNEDFTLPKCTDAQHLFLGTSITKLPDGFSLPECTKVWGFLANCYKLTTLREGFTLPQCTEASYAFQNCSLLRTLPDGFSLPRVQNANVLFLNCYNLANLPSSFSLPSASNLNQAFQGCTSLTSEDVELIISTLPTHTSGTHKITLPNTDAAKAVDVSGLADKGWTVNYA